MLVQLFYTSRLIFDASAPEGRQRIEDIVSRARERNMRAGITGFLIAGKDWAAQILEGDQDAVHRTFQRILRDHRHQGVRLVDLRIISRRSFDGWSLGMSHRPLDEMPFELHAPRKGAFHPLTFETILSMAQLRTG